MSARPAWRLAHASKARQDSRHVALRSDMTEGRIRRPASAVILVVENDVSIRSALVDILLSDGYRVAEAANGGLALSLLRGGLRPSLIILDLMMPIMNGWEFRSKQTADPALASIPVVVLMGAVETPLDPGVLSAAGLLRKPISSDALLVTAARLTRG